MSKSTNRKGTRQGKDIAKICLIVGMILTFLLFAFCVFAYIYRELEMSHFAKKALQTTIDPIDYIKELQAYYRDASNFNFISIVYAFITTVVVAFLGFLVERQKTKMEQYEKSIKDGQLALTASLAKANNISAQFEIVDCLHIALVQATTLYTFAYSKASAGDASQPTARLRDALSDAKKSLQKATVKADENELLELMISKVYQ